MNYLAGIFSILVGFSSSLIIFAATYSKGNIKAIIGYLKHRREIKNTNYIDINQLEMAKEALKEHFITISNPDLAFKSIPFSIIIGCIISYFMYYFFENKKQINFDTKERMLLRLAYRKKEFTKKTALQFSPLTEEQFEEAVLVLVNKKIIIEDKSNESEIKYILNI